MEEGDWIGDSAKLCIFKVVTNKVTTKNMCMLYIQGDQLYMAVFLWYFVTRDLTIIIRYCTVYVY